MNDNDNKFMSCLGLLFLAAIAIVVGSILDGLALVKLWEWFVIPTFGLPRLTIPVAIGIALIASFLTKQEVKSEHGKKDTSEIVIGLIGVLGKPLLVIAVGWIVHLFV